MFYLTGDGRLRAFAMITRDSKAALGVPVTDIDDVKALAYNDKIVGFDDEAGMIHSHVDPAESPRKGKSREVTK